MKKSTFIIAALIFLTVCLTLLTGCNSLTQQPSGKDQTEPAQIPSEDGVVENKTEKTKQPTQRWSLDDFTSYYEDSQLFAPTTDDYLLMESYDQRWDLLPEFADMSSEKSIPVRITILRSFDESGEVVSQFMRYSFLESCAEDEFTYYNIKKLDDFGRNCYTSLANNGKDYPLLVQIDNIVYAQAVPEDISEQRTKEQFAQDYAADGTKHWFSKPLDK